ncbi:MAG TPA: hypothetical protein DHV28_01685 [Ignavibacteriales bacterium]|nr:hypothetical protein [Ignavibacteriales bacterium]
MKYLKIISLLLLLIFTSCENEELLNVDSAYKELLVVQSEITPGSNFPGVRLTKTLPLGIPYDINLSEIKDATIYIRIDSIKIIPLHYTTEGFYKPLYDLPVSSGEYYELFGERGNQTFYAKTKIPYQPNLENVFFDINGFYAGADVYSYSNECYAALWKVDAGTLKSADDFFQISTAENEMSGGTISVRAASYPQEYQTNAYNGKRYIQIFSFDESFEKYFTTKSGNQVINNPYVQGTGSTDWNVEGRDVVGMFIGYARSDIHFVN